MKNRFIIFAIVFIFLMIGFISIGYGAFSTNLSISGDAIVRRDADIRITNLEVVSKTNGGVETYNSTFSKSLTSMSISLPNTNSTVVYRVSVTNKNNSYFTLNSISAVSNSNSNVSYNVSGVNLYDIYDSNTLTFNITFTTSSVNQNLNITLKFDFQVINNIEWSFDYTGGEQSFSVPYNGTYKLETWGASGNVVQAANVVIGYGGYSKGEIVLSHGKKLNVVVGGAGDSAIGSGYFAVGSGGYNGGGYGKDYSDSRGTGGGGGATHIATVVGVLSSLEGYKGTYSSINGAYDSQDILIVAGGGGGVGNFNGRFSNINMTGGSGGGFVGGTGISPHVGSAVNLFKGYGGTQTSFGTYSPPETFVCGTYCGSDGAFGKGSDCSPAPEGNCSGGGGGFYGGSFNTNYSGSGGGGSGYIGSSLLSNKAMYGYGVDESSSVHTKTISVNAVNNSPLENTAKIGNGYARISLILN